jgi:hypothetical protein
MNSEGVFGRSCGHRAIPRRLHRLPAEYVGRCQRRRMVVAVAELARDGASRGWSDRSRLPIVVLSRARAVAIR